MKLIVLLFYNSLKSIQWKIKWTFIFYLNDNIHIAERKQSYLTDESKVSQEDIRVMT